VGEVAEILACSEVTAKVHLHRARKRLAELLSDDQPTGEPTKETRHVS
jgi:DNA-directed RNA polymerase specialized sigma24 family protein